MRIFFADTNFYLRFILQDNQRQARLAESYFKRAKEKKLRIVFTTEVILEMAFVLKSNYSYAREIIARYLSALVSTSYLEVRDRDIWIKTLDVYPSTNLDLLDVFLFYKSRNEGGKVLSFDYDFKKLTKRFHNL